MSTVQEIEAAISRLSREDVAKVRAWLNQFVQSPSEVSPTLSWAELEHLTAMTPSQVQPPGLKTPEERAAAFLRWADSHARIRTVADDSRESIYEGRGE
jgi:hypothetical protein